MAVITLKPKDVEVILDLDFLMKLRKPEPKPESKPKDEEKQNDGIDS